MEIPNLSTQAAPTITPVNKPKIFSWPLVFVLIILGLGTGFIMSRTKITKNSNSSSNIKSEPAQKIDETTKLEVGKVYGNTAGNFKDSATGTIEKGSINGEGTHILNREGGKTQRASLTSSVVDLDLFVDKKVEVKGETNSSTKTAWLMDVGAIKILE